MARIAILEDHGMIAHTVARSLEMRGHSTRTLQPKEGDPVATIVADEPDLALLDLDLGAGIDTFELITALVRADVPVLMVTGVDDPVQRARCVAAGAVGIIDKSSSFDELLAGIEQVLDQGTALHKHDRDEHLAALRAHEREERERLAPFAELTRREAEVLGQLMRGRTISQIAERSFVSRDTVRTQVRAIRTKLGVSSQLAAITLARNAGWQPPTQR